MPRHKTTHQAQWFRLFSFFPDSLPVPVIFESADILANTSSHHFSTACLFCWLSGTEQNSTPTHTRIVKKTYSAVTRCLSLSNQKTSMFYTEIVCLKPKEFFF